MRRHAQRSTVSYVPALVALLQQFCDRSIVKVHSLELALPKRSRCRLRNPLGHVRDVFPFEVIEVLRHERGSFNLRFEDFLIRILQSGRIESGGVDREHTFNAAAAHRGGKVLQVRRHLILNCFLIVRRGVR